MNKIHIIGISVAVALLAIAVIGMNSNMKKMFDNEQKLIVIEEAFSQQPTELEQSIKEFEFESKRLIETLEEFNITVEEFNKTAEEFNRINGIDPITTPNMEN